MESEAPKNAEGSDDSGKKKTGFFTSLKRAFKKATTRKYSRKDLKKIWDIAKDTGADFKKKPLRETGLLIVAAIVPGAGFAWVAYRLKRWHDLRAANDNQKPDTPAVKADKKSKVSAEKKKKKSSRGKSPGNA